jgi:hypothetical protein
MLRTILLALAGLAAGVLVAAGLLGATAAVLRWQTEPLVFKVKHDVIYLGILLGAGFGAVTGAVAGLAHVLDRAWRQRSSP